MPFLWAMFFIYFHFFRLEYVNDTKHFNKYIIMYIFCLIYYSLSENIAYKYNNVSILPCQLSTSDFPYKHIQQCIFHSIHIIFPTTTLCVEYSFLKWNIKIKKNITVDNDLLFTSNFYFQHIFPNHFSFCLSTFHSIVNIFLFIFFIINQILATQTNNNNEKYLCT